MSRYRSFQNIYYTTKIYITLHYDRAPIERTRRPGVRGDESGIDSVLICSRLKRKVLTVGRWPALNSFDNTFDNSQENAKILNRLETELGALERAEAASDSARRAALEGQAALRLRARLLQRALADDVAALRAKRIAVDEVTHARPAAADVDSLFIQRQFLSSFQ